MQYEALRSAVWRCRRALIFFSVDSPSDRELPLLELVLDLTTSVVGN